jgi:hypothetical protein
MTSYRVDNPYRRLPIGMFFCPTDEDQHQASFRQMQLISAMRERSLALLFMTTNTPYVHNILIIYVRLAKQI